LGLEVLVDDIVIVKPDQKIPVDGIVEEGYSSVDESILYSDFMRLITVITCNNGDFEFFDMNKI
jgi:high-affinity K+ transport system ATPase subunit B